MKYAILIFVSFAVTGCCTPQAPRGTAGSELKQLTEDLEQAKMALAAMESRVVHLETELAAGNTKSEFTEFALDEVGWPDRWGWSKGPADGKTLCCHARDWRGFGKMKEFTRLADPVFFLEAEGRQSIQAGMAEGGITSDDGSIRLLILRVHAPLEPGVTYRLRARNNREQYRWELIGDLAVVAK